MTIQVLIGGDDVQEFATTTGHGDFIRWTESLDVEKFPLISHLSDWGWVNEIDSLSAEVKRAMNHVRPKASLKKTLDGFLAVLKDRPKGSESVMLSDGLSSKEEKDGEWWVDGKPV